MRARDRERRAQDPEARRERERAAYAANAENRRAVKKAWHDANRDRVSENAKRRRALDPDKARAKARAEQKKRRSTPRGKLENACRVAIYKGLVDGGKYRRRTFDAFGYTVEQLMEHLEARFLPGMTWGNYGVRGWHVDHIRPLSSFEFETVEDPGFKEAWRLENLQPLWAVENWSKGAKLAA